jgi:hypothetical protein
MNVSDLPVGANPPALDFPHFPTPQQAFVWRNWNLVPPERLTKVLGASRAELFNLARGMGLSTPPRVNKEWLARGYCTLIRNNWHLLPYEQLLALLGWTAEQLDFTLREDDFLWVKLGKLKPAAEPIRYAPLTSEQIRATNALRAAHAKHFSTRPPRDAQAAFAFLKEYRRAGPARPQNGGAFDLKLAYSYTAAYGDPLLSPESDPYPDGMLARYAASGVNAVWLQGVLYTLAPWKEAPDLSKGRERRLKNLRALCRRAAKFGIGVFLYFNEPRPMPLSFFAARPGWPKPKFIAENEGNLCTSLPAVQSFLRDGAEYVFRHVPELAGAFTITMSENHTNCFSRYQSSKECPRCSKRPAQEVIAEVNRLLFEGMRAAKKSARLLAWTWGWPREWDAQAVDLLPGGVELMAVSEWGLPTSIGGVAGSVVDYSISRVGPSEQSSRLWQRAKTRGLKTIAKVQLNNSWELSAVPFLPVPDLIEQHLGNLRREGVDGLMVSWTVGGYPGGNLELLSRPSAELAVEKFGARAAPLVRKAWRAFSAAFTELPFDCSVIYLCPNNTGPANLLHEKPTGYAATMVQGFPYDDLKRWRSVYPEDVFEQQFRELSHGWKQGLMMLARARQFVPPKLRTHFAELERIARAAHCHFRSTYLQIKFVRQRDSSLSAEQKRRERREILKEELRLARELHGIVQRDSRIGFEAANHYSYTLNDLKEKVIQCEWMMRRVSQR